MPTLIQFGAGNIGRGFIAPLFTTAGWRVVFIEVDPVLVGAINRRGGYAVTEADASSSVRCLVGPVTAIDGRDVHAAAAAVADADLAATAVGAAALPRIAPVIAAALERRARPLDILVCENGAAAAATLRSAVQRLCARPFGAVRTSIGRMIPAPAPGADPLDVVAEPYRHLPIEAQAFTGPIPDVAGLEPCADFDLVLGQKLHLHNLTHACLAYAGHARGLATIADCMADRDLADAAERAGREAGEALARAHGRGISGTEAIRRQCRAMLDGLLVRYRNPHLRDPVSRVARDPWRKLAADDRLVGAARLCLEHGVHPGAILDHIVLACRYQPADDEPRAPEFRALRDQGPLAVLSATTRLPGTDPCMRAIAAIIDHDHDLDRRRAAAAATMRASGLSLRPDEAERLEIADFGLGRYDEFGLAIHVYVNTERCCAKELIMLPGQCCPEHRHPPVAGGPGKEETFRVRSGEVDLFLPGPDGDSERDAAVSRLPADKRSTVSVFRRIHLRTGEQCTLAPDTRHWFVAGPAGAVVSEFSTCSRDEADVFTDPAIRRVAG